MSKLQTRYGFYFNFDMTQSTLNIVWNGNAEPGERPVTTVRRATIPLDTENKVKVAEQLFEALRVLTHPDVILGYGGTTLGYFEMDDDE